MRICSITPGLTGDFRLRSYRAGHETFSVADDLNVSADALPSSISGSLQRCGTTPRDFHCWKVLGDTPSSSAPRLISSQSISGDAMSGIHTDDLSVTQGQFVQRRRQFVSLQFVSMISREESEAAFDERARAMIVAYQDAQGLNNAEMAAFLGGDISEDNYISYVRRRFPGYLIWRFCKKTGLALDGVPVEAPPPTPKKRKRPRKLKVALVDKA